MVAFDQVTICMTMGKRPDHLRRTIESLGDIFQSLPVIAINDFGDDETSSVFRKLSPNGTLINLGGQVGHHPAVDAMYEQVKTPFIFHMEDDWGFFRQNFIEDALSLLEADPQISSVCFREISDFPLSDADRSQIARDEREGIQFNRLDGLHEEWHAYTFNPHLARKSLWEDIGKFSQFKKERHISRKLRAQGRYTAFLEPGACAHIGNDISVANNKPSLFKRIKKNIRAQFKTGL